MKLIPMTDGEFKFWAPRSRANYAKDKMKANGYTETEAREIAEKDFKRLLPDGLYSMCNYLFTAKDDAGNILGFVWYREQGADDNRKAFVCDVVIEEQYRGKGYGRKMMLLLEEEVKKSGLKHMGLHVFGFNEPAINLYQSLGYLTTDLVMEKEL